jgi:hypothetical protein
MSSIPRPQSRRAGRLWSFVALFFLAAVIGFGAYRRFRPQKAAEADSTSNAEGPGAAPALVPMSERPRASIRGQVRDPAQRLLAGVSVCAWVQPGLQVTSAQTRQPQCVATDTAGEYVLDDLYSAVDLELSANQKGFPPQPYLGANGEASVRLAESEQRSGINFTLHEGGVEIRGRVLDVTGGVVPGALVTSGERAMATSDSQGDFSLWGAPGSISLVATAVGYASGRASGYAPGQVFSIHLVPGSTLVGRVVIAGSETPVADARIASIAVEGGSAQVTVQSGVDGRFRVDGLAPGRYRLEATAEGREGYSRSSITLGMGETSGEIELEMDRAYVVVGRVLEKASGAPCPGGTVTIADAAQNESSEAEIRPDGAVRMASVIPGDYKVRVSCTDHVDGSEYPNIVIKDRDAPFSTWEVEKGAGVRVAVVDSRGKGVSRATVDASSTGGVEEASGAGTLLADGTFRIRGLKPGSYRVSARGDEGGVADKEVNISEGPEPRVELALSATGTIVGMVSDEAEHGVPAVRLAAKGPTVGVATSAEDGSFRFTDLPPGEYIVSTVQRRATPKDPPVPQPSVRASVATSATAKVRLVIARPAGMIAGQVQDSDAQPVTDAFVEVAGVSGRFPGAYGAAATPVVTDTDGRFRIEGLAAGAYRVRAYRKGGGEVRAENIKTGTQSLSLTLARGASISGTLTARGVPVERFTLTVREQATHFRRNELFFHARGFFALRDLPAGKYELQAETPTGSVVSEFSLVAGEQKAGLTLALQLRGVVRGRVVELEGATGIAGIRVDVSGVSPVAVVSDISEGSRNVTLSDGQFTLTGVLPGKWQLTLVQTGVDDRAPIEVDVEVKEGGIATDVGSIRFPRSRLQDGEEPGMLGLGVSDQNDASEAAQGLEVIAATGAAAAAGIKVGDVVVSIDGTDVRRTNRYLFAALTTVAPGKSVTVGLLRGGQVTLVARSLTAEDDPSSASPVP